VIQKSTASHQKKTFFKKVFFYSQILQTSGIIIYDKDIFNEVGQETLILHE